MPSSLHVVDANNITLTTHPGQSGPTSQNTDCFTSIGLAFTKYLGGSPESFGTLMHLGGPFVRRTVLDCGVPNASVDDVTQLVWCRLINKASSVRDPRAVTAWLTTTARREALRWLRRHQTESRAVAGSDPHAQVPNGTPGTPDGPWQVASGAGSHGNRAFEPAHVVEIRERNALLREHIERLPQKCQRILHAIADSARPDYKSLADQLGMAVGSVGPTRSRCLRQLRESLAADPRWTGFSELTQV